MGRVHGESCCACCWWYIRIAQARTLKMVPYTKYLLALLVILEASQALPVSQKDEKNVEEEIVQPIDEAKEFKYELNRDLVLQGGHNGGQSGWVFEQITHGATPEEVISGSVVRRKRQSDLEEAASMPDHLQAPDAKDGYFGPYEVFQLPANNGQFEQEEEFTIPAFKSYPAIP